MSRPPRVSRTASAIGASVFAELAARIEARVQAGADLIELHIGDTHRVPHDRARFAYVDGSSFDPSLYRYGAVAGLEALKLAMAEGLAAKGHGPATVDPGRQVLVASGATHALFCAARAVLDPGDEVLVAAPYWPLSVGVLRAAGAVTVEVPITSRLGREPTLDAGALFEEALTPRTRALYLTTPNNPDGKVLSAPQLASIARLAESRGLWVIADEVYCDYVYDGAHVSIARQAGMEERTLSVYSLSKSHAMAGVRVGFVVAPERVVALARRVATHTVFNVPVAAQRVALAALEAGSDWVDEARRDYRGVRDAVLGALGGAGVRVASPEGGSYAFIDFVPVLDGRPLRELLERAIDQGVLLAPGDAFGSGFGSCARLCFTSAPPPRVLEGVARLREALHAFAR